ncbi:hypothetical protein POSPLADRAFT_1074813 [Postia placenta MAD-698-R-SB12]|uniref:BHLH domain-containing protein n=1 Tax=Postia placenta MAD-698-R-SB12 TaxID=670580 RepID=A0A1X6MXW2_9APHY|nr:hypothetical protein POSPLADRAFT_1074813 [Postia placenta MAD-698-R-SB12]OSX61080.1 hypothetical protein POSPLADRAFT_1074813 [Postia placenta MAD-698-R-SB12]
MNLDPGAETARQNNFIHTLDYDLGSAPDPHGRLPAPSSSSFMNYHSQPPQMANMQLSMDTFQGLLNAAENAGQQGSSPQVQATPQALLEQQMRLQQLQQLQQLQNQIFQQQLELLSGGTQPSFTMSPGMDRHREQQQQQQQYPPTPASSTELRAQRNPEDFISPFILHSNPAAFAHLVQGPSGVHHQGQGQTLPDFLPAHMVPSAPHSAPANLVFASPADLPSPAELDFNNISPLTSPWLTPYTGQPASAPSAHDGPSSSAGSKRRMASSSGDESAVPAKPVRKRPSPAVRAPAPTKPRRATAGTARGTRSANSTPLFPAMATGGSGVHDIPNDTPSPIELPPMPPPAQLPAAANALQMSPISPGSGASAAGSASITPVTPASIMNLGRLGLSTSGPAKGDGGSKRRESISKARAAPKSAEKTSAVPLVSPSLKPIRPAGNTPTMEPSAFAQPVVQFRKSSHKAAEQKRRDSLKTSFDDLRLLLPPIPLPSEEGYPDEPILPGAMPPRGPPKGNAEGPNRGVSKLQLLRCGNDFIKVLKSRVDRRDDEIERLRKEIARLRLLVRPEDAEAEEPVDLEKDLDAIESAGGGLFTRAMREDRGMSAEGDDVDEEGGESYPVPTIALVSLVLAHVAEHPFSSPAMPPPPIPLRHPLSIVFLLHIALEVPIAVVGLWSPASLPFMQLTNTTLVFLKMYSALVAGLCLSALLVFTLPEFLPGKRALGMALCFYHVTCSTILFNAPRFIPHSFGPFAESYRATPEVVWGTLHGIVGFTLAAWWQATLGITQLAARQAKIQ